MSLHSIVSDGLVGRLHQRRDPSTTAAVARPRTSQFAVLLTGASMRVLETGLALAAIGFALLIGFAR